MDQGLLEAVQVSPPGTGNIYALATTASSRTFVLPATFVDSWITIQSDTLDNWFAFKAHATTGATVSVSAVSTISGSTPLAAATNGGAHLPAGQEKSFNLTDLIASTGAKPVCQPDGTYPTGGLLIWIGIISTDTTGYFRFWKSAGPPTRS